MNGCLQAVVLVRLAAKSAMVILAATTTGLAMAEAPRSAAGPGHDPDKAVELLTGQAPAPAPGPAAAPSTAVGGAPAAPVSKPSGLAARDSIAPAPVASGPTTVSTAEFPASSASPRVATERRAPPTSRDLDSPEPQPVASSPSSPNAVTRIAAPPRQTDGMERQPRYKTDQAAAPETSPLPPSSPTTVPLRERVEVRRAVPVARSENGDSVPPAAPPASSTTQPGVTERRIVERMPDGRTRTTVIRTIRAPGKGQSAEPVREAAQ